MRYMVAKLLDGYTTCFRQWQAHDSHCKYLHGYALQFKLYFSASSLDYRGWVWDFAWLRNEHILIDNIQVSNWFDYMFDHTVLVAQDDPNLDDFAALDEKKLIQMRVLPAVSCENIAQLVLQKINPLVQDYTKGEVTLTRVDVYEQAKNCASVIL